ncbi:eukaryotic translation initiation factor 3 subunit B [Strongylocentrotus purpuratus]|uniref:Eukaryotic translation initiation factor 3 subunit B n=1 Tax=Strongylocentrotus purpuratus TaxID=7668 RepID=A0A7M7NRY5_STRPU|nr:eukaryotic translation initiation factor 3 subunit B [Strongylocentrotus purpuratus]|eukprot:XP_796053.3 PREDICTED: eukaryotic translation initiation factor 3 subunit B [Strongylocentrotus purpuratus]
MAEGSERERTSGRNKMDRSHENDLNDEEENGYEEEPDFSDPESYVDNITDEELLGDILRTKPKEALGIDSVIVIDNIPQVGTERLPKLKNVIRKVCSKYGEISTEHYPESEDGKTKGYVFVEYKSPENAIEAAKQLSGYKLDKQHTFAVNLITDFDKFMNLPDEWTSPEKQPYKDHGNMRNWLLDKECNDQYSVISDGGETTAILLNSKTEANVVEERKRWTETYIRWSPLGTYLVTFHQKGIALWGGENFQQIRRFAHPGVQLIDVSPCERYIVTFSPLNDPRDETQAIIIWDIKTGIKKRGFSCDNASNWPVFKWSHDGKFFARMAEDTLGIYETPSFGLLDKKSLKIPGIREFCWSPASNIMSYWTPEEKENPARVTLMAIPSRKELRVKNLFSVADCKLHWQKQGHYMCCKVDRLSKSKKNQFTNFEIFRMQEKQIPVDSIEVKETIMAFAWEPTGNKFAILLGESPRISASFYNIKPKGKVELIKTIERKTANSLFWAPTGQFVVLAGLRSMNGVFEFIDTGNDTITVMNSTEHFMATDVEWDPTGRYVITGVSWWSHKVDNAYWIWSFQGKLLQKCDRERFCQALWRPRPQTPLTEEKIKEIKKNMKSYSKIFEIQDAKKKSKASKELIERRQQQMNDFKEIVERMKKRYDAEKETRLGLRDGVDTDELEHDDDNEEEVVEFFIGEECTEVDEFEHE